MKSEQEAKALVWQSQRDKSSPTDFFHIAVKENTFLQRFRTEAALSKYVSENTPELTPLFKNTEFVLLLIKNNNPIVFKACKSVIDIKSTFGAQEDTFLHLAFAADATAVAAFLLVNLRADITKKNALGEFPFQYGKMIRLHLTIIIAASLKENALSSIVEADDAMLLTALMGVEKISLHDIERLKVVATQLQSSACKQLLDNLPPAQPKMYLSNG